MNISIVTHIAVSTMRCFDKIDSSFSIGLFLGDSRLVFMSGNGSLSTTCNAEDVSIFIFLLSV